MVAGGHWVWDQAGEYFNIPLQNFWGWWLTIFVAFLFFLVAGRITSEKVQTKDHSFDQLAIISYALAGLSSIVMDFQIGLAGAAMAGIFAMTPWAVLGWLGKDAR